MTLSISNQKPALINPLYPNKPSGDMDINGYIDSCIIDPIMQPINPSLPVDFKIDGNPAGKDDIRKLIFDCSGETVNSKAEQSISELFAQTMLYYDKNSGLGAQDIFSVQSAVKEKMDFPSPVVIYNANTDIIPVSKKFLAGQCSYDELFATYAFFARSQTLGVYFLTESVFDNFKTAFDNYTQTLIQHMTQDTINMCTEFKKLTLSELTESLILRNNDSENCEEYSFARVLMSFITAHSLNAPITEYGLMPFNLGELICPRSIVFINIERHAKSTSSMIKKEWETINKSLELPYTIVSNKKLQSLTGVVRNLSKIKTNAAMASVFGIDQQYAKAARMKFKKTKPSTVDLARIIAKLVNKMSFVNKSENTYKKTKMTFAKPNRRNPDDFNLKGKITSTQYKPDIHLYIDTSGSITEKNYQDAVKACIKMAKRLNVNLYFNSFSGVISQCSKLNVKDKPLAQIYTEFQKIPKVTGGTAFDVVWRYINASKTRQKELSILMTDFEWTAPNRYIKHPENLYYTAVSVDNSEWPYILKCANEFMASMKHIDPECRYRIMF